MITVSFFGHRRLFDSNVEERLYAELVNIAETNDAVSLLIGTHGEFDRLALSVAREIRRTYANVRISVVLTSLSLLRKGEGCAAIAYYNDVQTVVYDIEEEFYKKRITATNRKMVDDSDVVICYANMQEYRSGAKDAVKYAMRQNKRIINLFTPPQSE